MNHIKHYHILLFASLYLSLNCGGPEEDLSARKLRPRPNHDSLLSAARTALAKDPANPDLACLVTLRELDAIASGLHQREHRIVYITGRLGGAGYPRSNPRFVDESTLDTVLQLRSQLLERLPRTVNRQPVLYGIALASMLLRETFPNDTLPAVAKEYLLQALREGGGDVRTYHLLASCYLRIGEFDKAFNAITEALRIDPEGGSLYKTLGIVQTSLDRIEDASHSYRTAVHFGFEDPDEYLEMAGYYMDGYVGESDTGPTSRTIRSYPSLPRRLFDFGRAFFQSDKLTIATALCTQALALDSTYLDTRLYLIRLEDLSGDVEKAAQSYASLYDVATADQKKLLAARPRVIEKVLQSRPGDDGLLANLGEAYRSKGDNDRAIAIFRELLVRQPQAGQPHLSLGLCFWAVGDTTQALNEIEEAMMREVSDSTQYYLASHWLFRAGRLKASTAAMRRYLETTYNALEMKQAGNLHSWRIYRPELSELIRLGYPRDVVISALADFVIGMQCSWEYENTRSELWYNGAVDHLRRAVKSTPKYAPPYSYLAHTYTTNGDSILAKRYFEQAKKMGFKG